MAVKINFGEVEEYKPLEPGKYHLAVTDVEVKEHGENSKHPGHEYWMLTLTVQDGPQEGKTQNLMVTLPPHYEPFTLVNVLRATVGQHEWTDQQVKDGEVEVDVENLEGLEFVATVRRQKNNSDFNEVRGIREYNADTWDAGDDLLP